MVYSESSLCQQRGNKLQRGTLAKRLTKELLWDHKSQVMVDWAGEEADGEEWTGLRVLWEVRLTFLGYGLNMRGE